VIIYMPDQAFQTLLTSLLQSNVITSFFPCSATPYFSHVYLTGSCCLGG